MLLPTRLLLLFLTLMPMLLVAQLPINGITYDNLLECDKPLNGSIIRIVQTKIYQNGLKERTRYFFDPENRLQRVDNSGGTEIEYAYALNGNLETQVIRQDGRMIDSLVGVYTDRNRLRGLMTYRGKERHLISVQQVMYNKKNKPERIRIDEIKFYPETNTAKHHAAWQDLKWKNDSEFSVDEVSISKQTKYIVKNATTATLDAESGCLLKLNDNKRTISNVQGVTTVEIYQLEEDPTADKVMVEYEYDEQGNWIEQRHFAITDGAKSRKKQRILDVKRKIQYRE